MNSSREPSSRHSCRAVLLTVRQRLEVLRRVPPSAGRGVVRGHSAVVLRRQRWSVEFVVVVNRVGSSVKSSLDVDRRGRRQPSRCRETAVRLPTNSLVSCFRSRPASWTVDPGTSSLSGAVVTDSSPSFVSWTVVVQGRVRLSGHMSELYTVP